MTTQSWSTVIDHTTDAAFRTWGAELAAKFAAAGLTQTADTGQINWASVTRAGTTSDAGYEIYFLTGALHSTAPIYLKIYYGTGGSTTNPRLRLEVGTASNGTGTITGTAKTAATIIGISTAPTSTVTAYQSWLCATNGHVSLVWKTGASSVGYAIAGFAVCRTVDSSGAFTATGALVTFGASSASNVPIYQSLTYSPAKAFVATNATGAQCLVPGAETNSVVGSTNQAFLFWMLSPQVVPIPGLCAVYTTEASEGSTFTAALVGATSRTYISIGRQIGTQVAAQSTLLPANFLGTAMLWE